MILFYAARRTDIPTIQAKGLSPRKRKGYTLHTNLKSVRKAGRRSRILAIDPGIDGSWLTHCLQDDKISVSDVRRRWIMNLEPYAKPKAVSAGGGIITRRREGRCQVLLIYRRGYWDLPKGKKDSGESIRSCAKREVMEEVGLGSVTIVKPLGKTIHGYRLDDRFMVKTTNWYEMVTEEAGFIPQREEGIEKVQWFEIDQAVGQVGYPSLRALLRRSSGMLCDGR